MLYVILKCAGKRCKVKWFSFSTPFLPLLKYIFRQWEKSLLFKIHSNSLLNCRFLKLNTRTFNYFWHPCPSVCPHPKILGGQRDSLWTSPWCHHFCESLQLLHPTRLKLASDLRRLPFKTPMTTSLTISTRSIYHITSRKKQKHFKHKLSLWFLLSPSSSLLILFSFLFFFPLLYNFPPLPH